MKVCTLTINCCMYLIVKQLVWQFGIIWPWETSYRFVFVLLLIKSAWVLDLQGLQVPGTEASMGVWKSSILLKEGLVSLLLCPHGHSFNREDPLPCFPQLAPCPSARLPRSHTCSFCPCHQRDIHELGNISLEVSHHFWQPREICKSYFPNGRQQFSSRPRSLWGIGYSLPMGASSASNSDSSN